MKTVRYVRMSRMLVRVVVLWLLVTCVLWGVPLSGRAQTGVPLGFVPEAWPKDTGAPVNSSPVLGDLDGDGLLEIVIGSDNNKVYAWKPDGTVMPGWPVTTNDSVRSSPALADIDGDGRLDVVAGSFDNKVYVWNFNGSLLAGWPVVTGSVVYSSPAIGDIDGDQRPEVVVGSFDNKVYAWNADGTLVRGWPKATGLFVYSSPALADLDRDGLVEVVVGTDNNRVFAWNGDGTDVEGWPTATEHVVPSSPAVGDIDADGQLDVVVGSWDKLFMWNGRGEQKSGWPVTAGHQVPSSPALADLNFDGRLETIVGCKDGRVYVWDAQGQLLPGWPAVTDAEITASPAVGDLNGDGKPEVVIGSKDSKIYIWDNEGRLLPGWPKNTGDEIASSPAIGDLDGDGTLELVIGSRDHKVYTWSFERTGGSYPTVVWGNFRGDPAHSGIYNPQGTSSRLPVAVSREQGASSQLPVAIQPVQQPQLPQTGAATDPGIRLLQDGLVSDLMISDYDESHVTLTWTAPPGLRTAQTVYEIRYSTNPVTEETWGKAQVYPADMIRPAPAGAREVYALLNLPQTETLYFAIKMKEGQQAFPLSNVARLDRLDTMPPAGIHGVKVAELSDEMLELSWQTTGDDGTTGTATTYDIRYAEVPIDELTWLRATQVENEPAPMPAGTEQTFQIRKPWDDREIFFGIKAIDEALNISELSDVAAWSPRDDIPPSRIVDLRVSNMSGTNVTIAWTAPGNSRNVGKALRYDIRYSDYPITEEGWTFAQPVENPPTPEPAGTPQTYTLQGIPIGAVGYIGIKTVDSSGNLSAISNVVETAMDDQTPPAAVKDVRIEQIGKDWVRVSWTATGDDGDTGTAAAYVLRYGGNAQVVKSWTPAIDAQEIPEPAAPGTLETATIRGLNENSTYYLGLRVLDKQGNASELSNIVQVKTFGRSTPDAITDLVIEEMRADSVTLNWTAPEDSGEETARVAEYDIRYAATEITEANWENATKIAAPKHPSDPGALETYTVKGLPQETASYLAIKSYDAVGNPSGLSNVLAIPAADTLAPEAVIDLMVEDAGTDWVTIAWTAPGDDKQQGQASTYLIRVASKLNQVKEWTNATDIPTMDLSPSPAGSRESFTINGLQSKSTFYVAVKATDEFGNTSELSNIVRARTKDANPPAAITDLHITTILEEAVVLEWTASGDDGYEGQAEAYDIRFAPVPLNDGNWETAQMVPVVPRPSSAGTTETLTVTDLAPNTLYYFAVVTVDTSGNSSPLSNVVDILTVDTIPPPTITTLRVKKVEDNAVVLTWLSPGDDEYRDMPERYEIRYQQGSDGLMSEADWEQGVLVDDPPIPSGKGAPEEFRLTGLTAGSLYSIGVKAFDEYDNASDISNVARVFTASDSIDDLAIFDFSGQSVTLTWTTPGGEISEAQRYDIRYDTAPITEENWNEAAPARTTLPQDLNVEEPTQKEKVELTELPPYEQLFFAVRVARPDPDNPLAGISNVVELNRIDIIPPGEVMNLEVADMGQENGRRALQLTWLAPGDNEQEGIATKYEIRYGTVPPTDENWDTLLAVTDVPEPLEAGTSQQAVAQVTPGEDNLYFAMKVFDEAFNVSGLSNLAQWSPEDHTPPAAVADLQVEQVVGSNITISWTAPGDNENRGVAAFYDIRYATDEADVKTWEDAMVVSGEPLPDVAGTRQEYTITGLQQDTMYYVALKTTDDGRNTSGLSNIASIRSADDMPPAAISDLSVGKSGDDWVELSWTASGDDGNSGRASSYSLRYATELDELELWEDAYEATEIPAPKNPGSREKFTVEGLQPNTNYYFAVRTVDNGGNIGEISNVAQSLTADGESSRPITDLVFVGGTDTTATLSWTAPRDRGPVDRIARYDVRYSDNLDTLKDWNSARKLRQALVPGTPGSVESIMIENLKPNERIYVALRAIDQQNNVSEMSNIAAAYTTDTVPPQPVTDLSVGAATEHSITLVWTVVADDPAHDVPEIYDIRYHLEPITDMSWESAESVSPADIADLQPIAPGVPMQYTVTGLAENVNYYFAVRARDMGGNLSPLSNVAPGRTSDVTPPQAVTDLQVSFPTSDSLMLSWTTPSDTPTGLTMPEGSQLGVPEVELTLQGYEIRYTTMPPANGLLTDQAWETAEKVMMPPEPEVPGTQTEFVVRNLATGQTYYLAMRAIDLGGNVSDISNTVVETTLPQIIGQPELAPATDTRAAGDDAWELQQGQEMGEFKKEAAGEFTLRRTGAARGIDGTSALTVVYPQGSRAMRVPQSELTFQVKTPQRFTVYATVRAVTGDEYLLCYSTDFGLPTPETPEPEEDSSTSEIAAAPEEEPRSRRLTEQRRMERVENYVFFPLDPAILDNEWHELQLNLARDLFEGTGMFYDVATRLAIRGNDVSFRGMTLQGPVFTEVDDFQGLQHPLEKGWNLHYGSGTVEVARETVADADQSEVSAIGLVPMAGVENMYLTAKSDSHRDLVLTYPEDATGKLSDKPYFLANVRTSGEFKVILKVATTDNREYYLAYMPESQLQQTGLSGNYIYQPLQVNAPTQGATAGTWVVVQANIEEALRQHQLDYAYTSWVSFHGKEYSIDNVRFSTAVLATALE